MIAVHIAIGIVAVEGIAWVLSWFADRVMARPTVRRRKFLDAQTRMLARFINEPNRREHIHPVLGWAYRPNYVSEKETTNAMGLRAKREYSPERTSGVRRIAAFGDSYVYCNEVSDHESWPAQIETSWRAEVLNYGAGGYGIDQALLRYRYEGTRLQPEVVVITINAPSVPRVVSRYRRFQDARDGPWFKPRFVVQGSDLRLLPPPAGTREEVEQLIANPESVFALGEHDDWYDPVPFTSTLYHWSAVFRVLHAIVRETKKRSAPTRLFRDGIINPDSSAFRTIVRVVEEFAADIRTAGATPIVLLLPIKSDLEMYRSLGHSSLRTLRAAFEQTSVRVVDAAPELAASPIPTEDLFARDGHLAPEGNALVAKALANALDLATRN